MENLFRARPGARPAVLAGWRQFLPGCLPRVNHTGPASEVFRCASATRGQRDADPWTECHGTGRPAGAARRAAGGTFRWPEDEAPRGTGPVASLRTVGGIDALVALQGVEDPTERRRRAVKQGRIALDALDELKLGLLAGTLDAVRACCGCSRRRPISGTARATRASTPCWPRSSCGSRSRSPR